MLDNYEHNETIFTVLLTLYCLNSEIIFSNLNVNKDLTQALYTQKVKIKYVSCLKLTNEIQKLGNKKNFELHIGLKIEKKNDHVSLNI